MQFDLAASRGMETEALRRFTEEKGKPFDWEHHTKHAMAWLYKSEQEVYASTKALALLTAGLHMQAAAETLALHWGD